MHVFNLILFVNINAVICYWPGAIPILFMYTTTVFKKTFSSKIEIEFSFQNDYECVGHKPQKS